MFDGEKKMERVFLIKYGEIAIKGKNRYLFINQLVNQIRQRLAPYGQFDIKKEQGRLYVIPTSHDYCQAEVMAAIKKVFGIVRIAPAYRFKKSDGQQLCRDLAEFVKEEYSVPAFSFKIEGRRADKTFPLNSMEMAAKAGAYLLEQYPDLTVDLHQPDERIWIEIRQDIFVYAKEEKGLQGMPLGSGGKAMLLLSGGIDSPVAAYMMAKRGVELTAVYFESPPYTSQRAKQKVIQLAEKLTPYVGTMSLHIVPFTDIQLAIYDQCPHDELTIIMRRLMMRIAERLAINCGAKALVTGESLAQVASQTIESLAVTNAVCQLPVFRPLIGMDKAEIVALAEIIDTFETSILPYEDCCTIFVAKHPVTRPKRSVIEASEKKLVDIDVMLEQAIAATEKVIIGNGDSQV